MAANVENMFYIGRDVPWHGLGRSIENAPKSDEALVAAGLDWNVNPSPVVVNGIEVPGYIANVRSNDNSVLGIVSDRYKIVQNNEAFAFTDSLIESGEVVYETAGSLANGKKVWMLARLPEQIIVGDKVNNFLVFTNSHDGTAAVRAAITPVRVVCQNTLNLALRTTPRIWATMHMGDLATKLEDAKRTLQLSKNYMTAFAAEAERLASIKISDEEFEKIVNELLPLKPEGQKGRVSNERVGELQTRLRTMYYEVDDLQNIKGTAWGVLNAVSDLATHTPAKRQMARGNEKLFERVLVGHALIDTAYKLVA